MPDGEVCIPDASLSCVDTRGVALACSLPAASEQEAADFLQVIGSGGALGTGIELSGMGVSLPRIREDYNSLIQRLVQEVERQKAAGQSSRQIASWVVGERRRIANQMRWRSGAGTRVLFEVRDWTEYGLSGRTFSNVERRYLRRGLRGEELSQAIIKGATKSNTGISSAALRGARYLRYGGRVIVVLSVATTTYTLLTAPHEELERIIFEETGGVAGGSAGAGLAVGACLVFGVASGGWGLLACGIVGGVGGGALGSYAGNRIYYSRNKNVELPVLSTGMLDASELDWCFPAEMCIAP